LDRTRRIVSVSLGSSKRDHEVEVELLGERFRIERIGTDGDLKKAVELISELDGRVDAFGMGGIDLYIAAGRRRYVLRDAVPLKRAARKTPIVDGSGLKDTLEREVVRYLDETCGFDFRGKTAFVVCAVDRFGLVEALEEAGCELVIGDLMFTLHVPIPIRTLGGLDLLARFVAPVACRLPFKMLYPTGKSQEESVPKYTRYYQSADLIAGDFLFIKKHWPEDLAGKTILTNTVTSADIEELRKRGVDLLVTTTPNLGGRSFGTNVMEALLVVQSGKRPEDLGPDDYKELLGKWGFVPRVEHLGRVAETGA